MFEISDIKNDLTGMGHGGTLKRVRNIYNLFRRAASIYLLKCHPLDVICEQPIMGVAEDLYDYALPTNFGNIIDLSPQSDRELWDNAFRNNIGQFDLEKAVRNRTITISSRNGQKYIRINWRIRQPKVLNQATSITANGTFSTVGAATGLENDTIVYYANGGSIRFSTSSASGDGVKNTTMGAVDCTSENGIANLNFALYLDQNTYQNLTSITPIWGNDLTANYWTGVAQTTQAGGVDFQPGWNIISVPWSTATQTGTVDPTKINSLQALFNTTGPLTNVRLNNFQFAIGFPFTIRYYSKWLFQDGSTGAWKSIPTQDTDIVVADNDSLPLYLYECLQEMAQQMEGTNAAFDINAAKARLMELYPAYKGAYPSQIKKSTARTGTTPNKRRWGYTR